MLLLHVTAAPAASTPAGLARAGQPVMGTVLQVIVVAADDATARRLAEGAIAEARRWDDLLTTWRPEGELAKLNTRAGKGALEISPALAAALRQMRDFSLATGGGFDPGVGPLVALWRGASPPPAARLKKLPPHQIASALTLEGTRATLVDGAALDAGGIGKGMALDAIAAQLRAGGAESAFLDFGGSSQLAIGAPPGSPRGWQVAVAGLEPGSLRGTIMLRDAALSTSRASAGPSKAGPIIDPRTGALAPAPRLATARAADATSAEAWTKAVIVFGRDSISAAASAGLEVYFEDAEGVTKTDGFPLQPVDLTPR